MLNSTLLVTGKIISTLSKLLDLGAGSTWPGHFALSANKNFIRDLIQKNPHLKIILIAGTNGKTTTAKMIASLLTLKNKTFFQNAAGANLLNGIASSLIENIDFTGKVEKDFAIFEVDENTLPLILMQVTPYAIVLLNLFRDQLDRYGELNAIARQWQKALSSYYLLNNTCYLILNADDPLIAYTGFLNSAKRNLKIFYFGLPYNMMTINQPLHEADSIYCPKCGNKLKYLKVAYSHLGDWQCKKCKLQKPKNIVKNTVSCPLPGLYNNYNIQAASTFGKILGLSDKQIESNLKSITPAFGRQEIIETENKKIQIFLSKNPTSFNQSLETVISLAPHGKKITVMFALNDRTPDGKDVSWIWDTNLESHIDKLKSIIISGDRCYDMGLRVFYSRNDKFRMTNFESNSNVQIFKNLNDAIKYGIQSIKKDEILYILPTYSAMLEVRKILIGRKLL